MTAYNKSTDFAIKDSLLSGNPSKLVRGSEIDTEFVAIQAADADNVKTSGLASGVATFLGTPTSANLAAALTDETGSGAAVFATSPTLVTPALGTPSALVGTNITGTASGLTAGNVTTNANLTGHITSVGNAAVLGSFTSLQLKTALSDETGSGAAVFATSPTLVTPALGTPSSGVVTNLTGTASININGTVGATTPAAGTFTTLTSTGNATIGDVATDILTVQAGSAAAPAIVPSGDVNTGVWFPAADTVAVSTGGTERVRIDSTGAVGIGTALQQVSLYNTRNLSGNATSYGFYEQATVQSDVTTAAFGYRSNLSTAAAAFTLASHYGFYSGQGTIGGTSAITNQYGFVADSTLTGATNNYGFYSNIAAAANRWNFYAAGTASNYFAGVTGIGVAPASTSNLTVAAGTTAVSSLNIPHGAAPTSPVNGDVWSTTAGLFIRINGVTKTVTLT